MNEESAQAHLRRVLAELDEELRSLLSQGVLTGVDVQKIRNQAEISLNALLVTREEASFSDGAKDRLMSALIEDFEKSIERTVNEAVGRRGDKALLLYRLYRIDKRIDRDATEAGMPRSELYKLQVGMDLLKSYIIRSLPEKGGIWGTPKTDVAQIVKNYEQTVLEHARAKSERPKLRG